MPWGATQRGVKTARRAAWPLPWDLLIDRFAASSDRSSLVRILFAILPMANPSALDPLPLPHALPPPLGHTNDLPLPSPSPPAIPVTFSCPICPSTEAIP
eukprot:GGOE01004620.1.p3 GENE.GGOE01004620.1~~GGOE01004620.1.p3  ORF type:complete len:100 (+),score=5.05 GGOE01004620.1:472-771(+)